jgi:tRNA-(ms[2]io[6]A)-hydroxylase
MPENTILVSPSPVQWIKCVLNDFDSFLVDHASAEKKASGMAMNILSHYPDKPDLVARMADLAIEELTHFKEVLKIIQQRGLRLKNDQKDDYVNQFLKCTGKGTEQFLVDRLLVAGIIEARGYQRFSLVAQHLPETETSLKNFYQSIARSEERHAHQFIELASKYAENIDINKRCAELLEQEAEIVAQLPIRAALH